LDEGRYISLAEAAATSGLSATHLRHLAEKGRIRAWKIGRNWVTSREAIAEYVADPEARSRNPQKNKRIDT